MQLGTLKDLYEARDQNNSKLFKYCTFDWIMDLLKDGEVFAYNTDIKKQKKELEENGKTKEWIALTTKRSSNINQYLDEYGTCEVTFDREVLKQNNEVYIVNFTPDWLDKRPSITQFITKGKYSHSSEYFKKNYNSIDWTNPDNYSKKFFKPYLRNNKLNVLKILKDYTVSEIELYIYDINYIPYHRFISSIGESDELVLINSPLKLVNDSVLQIIVPKDIKIK